MGLETLNAMQILIKVVGHVLGLAGLVVGAGGCAGGGASARDEAALAAQTTREFHKPDAGGRTIFSAPPVPGPSATRLASGAPGAAYWQQKVDYTIEVVAATVGHVRAGRLKALGVSTARRAAALPEVPTIAEAAGLPEYDAGVWIGYAAAAGLPREVLLKLSAEMQKAMRSKEFQDRLLAAGLDPVASTPEEMPAFMRREQERYAGVIKRANIKPE